MEKWLSELAFQISEKKKSSKRQRTKGKTYPSNHRVPKNNGDKKAFLSEQCRETEESNRMGKTRDLLKKIRDTKGTFHTKIGTINDRNSMELTESELSKERWQKYTEDLYKKKS